MHVDQIIDFNIFYYFLLIHIDILIFNWKHRPLKGIHINEILLHIITTTFKF